MDINLLIQNFISFISNPNAVLKIVLILLLLLFLLFTIIFARQVSHLLDLVNQVTFSPVFKLLTYSLIAITFILLLLVLFV